MKDKLPAGSNVYYYFVYLMKNHDDTEQKRTIVDYYE